MAPLELVGKQHVGMDIINTVGQVIMSGRGTESVLRDIADLVIEIMGADACAIWLYEDGVLKLKSGRGYEMGREEITLQIGDGITGRVAMSRIPMAISDVMQSPIYKKVMGDDRYRSILSVPMAAEENLVGVLNVQMEEPYEFTETEKKFMVFIASQLVGSIRNTQLYEEVVKGFREVAIIHQVGQIVNSVRKPEELFSVIAQTCAENLSARGCILRLIAPTTHVLEIKGHFGVEDHLINRGAVEMGFGIAGRCALERRPIISSDLKNDPMGFVDVLGIGMSSVICVPLVIKDKPIGTLAVFDKESPLTSEPAPFEEEDVGLISVIGTQVAMAIENATLYAEKDEKINELSLLLEITNIMRGAMDLEDLLYVILTSVTMAQGLGFNRALLFLTDRDSGSLTGKMAVGPMRPEEAARHWTAINPDGKSLNEIVMEYGQFNKHAGFDIDRIIKESMIPIHPEKGVLSKTVLEQKSFNVSDHRSPQGSEERVLDNIGFTTFATVPLVAKDRVIGVMVVDNLVNRKPITEVQVEFLQLFANQAASAIEMSRVYENLEHTNKRLVDARDLLVRTKTLATLGEFSAGIAHELRNPLVSIGGFAKRLTRIFEGDSKEARYSRIIANEVEGMEKILNQILDFAGGAKTERRKVDVILLLEQIFVLFTEQFEKKAISVETDYEERARYLYIDEVQMRQLFINLIKNAIEAMGNGGLLRVRSTLISGNDGGVGFEVADTGVGIPPEDIQHIFDPFFTRKSSGTGLGLTMCSRIVESNHGGRMFIESKIGRGTSVLVWLPPEVLKDPAQPPQPF